MNACPCNPEIAYEQCCGPLHAGDSSAASAEALMRSRYSAYVLGDAGYLLLTWHASTRPEALDLDDSASTRWLGLAVKCSTSGCDTATVEFVARYKVGGGPAVRLHEVSRFVHEQGRWYYVDGDFPRAGQAGKK